MGQITLITGPVRSGKSRYAVANAQRFGANVVFVATYLAYQQDPEMAERIRRHRAERPAWRTLEAPLDVAAGLRELTPAPSAVVIDCLTLWASARLAKDSDVVLAEWEAQLKVFQAAAWPTLIVTNELGWSLVPPEPESRRFRDLAGNLAQRTAASSTDVWLVVAGCPLRLK